MSPNAANSKSALRQKIRAVLANISPAVRAVESLDLCDRLETQLHSAHTILFFAPLPDELDVWPLLERFLAAGRTCALPFFDSVTQTYYVRHVTNLNTEIGAPIPVSASRENPPDRAGTVPGAPISQPQIVTGKFGVREPAATCAEISLERFDLVLVPGLAFDLHGHRLGRGQGFYDRLLEKVSGVKCGVCLDLQLLAEIPTEPHDVTVNFIVTPSRCVRRKS